MKEERYSISEASRLLDLENHVLRNWEGELGLHISRNEQGHRYYQAKEIQMLSCIKELKNKGFQLKAIKEIMPDLEAGCEIDVHKLMAAQVELEQELLEKPEIDGQGETADDGPENAEKSALKKPEADDQKEPEKGILGKAGEVVPKKPLKKPEAYEQKEPEKSIRGKNGKKTPKKPAKGRQKGSEGGIQKESENDTQGKPGIKPEEEKALLPSSLRTREEKMQEFEMIMGRIIGKALRDQAEEIGAVMGDQVGRKVRIEMDLAMEEQTKRTEEYFKKLDDSIRSHQRARQEAAIAREEGGKRKSRFFRKNKRKI